MNVKEAEAIIHSLSEPSKMPGYGYGLPTYACITGSKLREMPNTVCSNCYACKGHYAFKPVVAGQTKRLLTLGDPRWVQAMITVLKGKRVRYFRWHDSGDLQSLKHLKNIIKVAEGVSDMMFWLPTKEKKILLQYFAKTAYVPPNLCIRLSATLIDSDITLPDSLAGMVNTCSVHSKHEPRGFECKAYTRGGKCGECRACWDVDVHNVSYPRH